MSSIALRTPRDTQHLRDLGRPAGLGIGYKAASDTVLLDQLHALIAVFLGFSRTIGSERVIKIKKSRLNAFACKLFPRHNGQ